MTTITSAQAAKVFGAALFQHTRRPNSFVNMLTGAAPKAVKGDKNHNKNQSEKGAPVVMVNDLTKQAGDKAEVDLFHNLNGAPTMGDQKIEGITEDMDKVTFELKINQGRKNVGAGGRMTQQRTKHNLVSLAKTLLGNYFNDLQDEIATYHLGGARGSFRPNDMILPLADHPKFADYMVNDITPPTYDRHFYGGDAQSIGSTGALDSSDKITLKKVEEISLFLEEMAHPIKPVKFEADQLKNEEPFYVLFVTPRQYQDLWADAKTNNKMQELMASAMKRSKGFNHPLFQGDVMMWRNILIRKYHKPIRFYQNDVVDVSTNSKNAATTQQTVAIKAVDRAILLGAQALASAYGKTSSGAQFKMTTKKVDHDNAREISIAWMNGLKKIRFEEKGGRINDYGVCVLDTAITI